MTIRVGVAGALGRLGRVACAAIDAAADLELAAAFARPGGVRLRDALSGREPVSGRDEPSAVVIDDDLAAFAGRELDAIVDCTVAPVTLDVVRAALDARVPVVIGATGWSDDDVAALRARCEAGGVPAMLVPNFSLGAVLMMRFAEQAARVLPRAEIIELHHDGKRDAPSGTAKLTARRMEAAGAVVSGVHSVRLPGLVAHQEVLFGGTGETLTIRHDSLSRESFGPGIVAAVRAVRRLRGLTIGLDALLGEAVAS